MLNFKLANALLKRDTLGFCKKHLPRGKKQGQWWLVSSPFRQDRNPSFVVHLRDGVYKDLSTDEHGDLVDLLARLTGDKPADIVRDILGHNAA
jgi:DNA primase